MMQILKNNWLLFGIILIGFILRFYRLGDFPKSLNWDETALGYNTYSILKTARDEYGQIFPLVFKSFGDWKPGFYVYLAVPSVALFGLSEMAVRLPSALFGALAIFVIYKLSSLLFNKSIGLSSSLILAFSPWHIAFSRSAWEANIALFLILLGVFLFLKSLKEGRYLAFSFLVFGLTFLTYQGAKVFTPLILVILFIIYYQVLKRLNKKILFLSLLLILIFGMFIFIGMFGQTGGRAKVMSVFSYPRSEKEISEITKQDDKDEKSFIFQAFHSESLHFARGITWRYFNHFSPRYLFFEGDWSNKRQGVPYNGVLYLMDIVLLLAGVYYLSNRKENRTKLLIFLWLFIAPIPAAITRDSISAVRSLNMVTPLIIILSLGFYQFTKLSQENINKNFGKFLMAVFIIAYGTNVIYFLDQYFVHAPINNSPTSQYGYRELIGYINSLNKKYEKIIFTQKYGQPYIYWLFYNNYEPKLYQKQAKLTESSVGDVGFVERIDNVEFREINLSIDRNSNNALLVGDEFSFPLNEINSNNSLKILKDFNFQNGQLAFRLVESNVK